MADIGIPELLIVLAIILIIFGPSRLTGLGQSLGNGIREFRHSVRGDDAARPVAEASVVSGPIGGEPKGSDEPRPVLVIKD